MANKGGEKRIKGGKKITEAGDRIRKLREERGISRKQLADWISENVAASLEERVIKEAAITNIELGYIKTAPRRVNLDALFQALDSEGTVSLPDRQYVYSHYGYAKPYPLPTSDEMKAAKEKWEKTYTTPLPAYLLDCAQRLHAWNRFAPKLLGLSIDDPATTLFNGLTIFDITFSEALPLIEIANRDTFLRNLLRSSMEQDHLFLHEEWYERYIEETKSKYPEFKEIWESEKQKKDKREKQEINSAEGKANRSAEFILGNEVTIELIIKGDKYKKLKFKISRTYFANDERFFTVEWKPDDDLTKAQLSLWEAEERGKG